MLSVVIPAYNEAGAIDHTLSEIKQICESNHLTPYEVIVVDDGSSDETAELAAKHEQVKVIKHPHNIGYGRSLKDGITAAQYDTIVITDADMTYPFDEAPKLLKEYEKGFDMVVGARTGGHYRESMIKSPLRKLLKFLVEFTTGRKIPDINSGLRVFSKKTIMPYFKHLCDTFSFTTSSTLAYMMTGKFVTYLPIPYHKREGKTKVKLFKDSLRTLQYILQAINYYNPIKLFMLFAFFCVLLFVIFSVIAFFTKIKTAFMLAVGSGLIALLVVCFGLIADLLKQIMDK